MLTEIAAKTVAHMLRESQLLVTDPVYKWAQTRWPTFVEIALYVIDELVPQFGSDRAVMPLGADGTTEMLLNASVLFRQKGMAWGDYYHQTGAHGVPKFPEGPVRGWNTNDHGVNNAEGALRYPAVTYRLTNNMSFGAQEMHFVLGQLDRYQGQVASLFCADEVFCGREPHRGTETCAIVEAMASLEYAFVTLGDPSYMDRVERLAFNALPAALTADMWTHVYVQQANSVFAGRTKPAYPALRRHGLGVAHAASAAASRGCRGCAGDTPSGEDQSANYYGVSHFPCCITNFPQGWPKFAMSTVVAEPNGAGLVVASLVPSVATLPEVGVTVTVESAYPFGDEANITVRSVHGTTVRVRVPGWATAATVDGRAAANGTLFPVSIPGGMVPTTIAVALHPEVRVERGWGGAGNATSPPEDAVAVVRGPLVFALHPAETKRVVKSFNGSLPVRPQAVDYEISTTDPWNYALDLSTPPKFDPTPSPGWGHKLPFSTDDYPFSIRVTGRTVADWGFWSSSNITDSPPPSPIVCDDNRCGPPTVLRLVPFGGTNLRISVFPHLAAHRRCISQSCVKTCSAAQPCCPGAGSCDWDSTVNDYRCIPHPLICQSK